MRQCTSFLLFLYLYNYKTMDDITIELLIEEVKMLTDYLTWLD